MHLIILAFFIKKATILLLKTFTRKENLRENEIEKMHEDERGSIPFIIDNSLLRKIIKCAERTLV